MRYRELIKEGYKEAQAEFAAVAEPDQVKSIIEKYRSLVDRNQVSGNERNIDWWRKQGWDAFSKFVTNKSVQPSKKQVKKGKTQGDVIVLRDDAEWRIVIPLDKEASVREGRGSDWCTAKANKTYFEGYFYKEKITLVYCIKKSADGSISFKNDMWAIAISPRKPREYFNKQDDDISPYRFDNESGIDSAELISLANTNSEKIDKARRNRFAREETQLITVQNDGYMIEEIIKDGIVPSEQVQLTAVRQNGMSIRYIIQAGLIPGEAVQLAAVTQDEDAIQYIEDPSEAIQLAAVQKNGFAISHIEDPSEAIQLAAVEEIGDAIQYISYPSEAVKLAAVQQDGYAIRYINDPSEAIQLVAVQNNARAVGNIINPSDEVQLAAVRQDSHAVRFIRNPSDAVKKAAGLL